VLYEYLHREPQLRLQSQAHLLALKQLVFRMRICLRRAAHISINGYANGYDMDIGVKPVYIGALGSLDQSIDKSSSIQSNIHQIPIPSEILCVVQ
jgi:hypothetical protein